MTLKENDKRIQEMIAKGEWEECCKAAKICFCIETSKATKIKVINAFREKGKIDIKGDDLFLLGEKVLMALLYACATKNEKTQHFVVYAKTNQQKLWRYETPLQPS